MKPTLTLNIRGFEFALQELDLCNGWFYEETVRDEGKEAKNGSGFSTVRANSKPFAQNRSRKKVTLKEIMGAIFSGNQIVTDSEHHGG